MPEISRNTPLRVGLRKYNCVSNYLLYDIIKIPNIIFTMIYKSYLYV